MLLRVSKNEIQRLINRRMRRSVKNLDYERCQSWVDQDWDEIIRKAEELRDRSLDLGLSVDGPVSRLLKAVGVYIDNQEE